LTWLQTGIFENDEIINEQNRLVEIADIQPGKEDRILAKNVVH